MKKTLLFKSKFIMKSKVVKIKPIKEIKTTSFNVFFDNVFGKEYFGFAKRTAKYANRSA